MKPTDQDQAKDNSLNRKHRSRASLLVSLTFTLALPIAAYGLMFWLLTKTVVPSFVEDTKMLWSKLSESIANLLVSLGVPNAYASPLVPGLLIALVIAVVAIRQFIEFLRHSQLAQIGGKFLGRFPLYTQFYAFHKRIVASSHTNSLLKKFLLRLVIVYGPVISWMLLVVLLSPMLSPDGTIEAIGIALISIVSIPMALISIAFAIQWLPMPVNEKK